eukprot:Cvel_24641.t1-p1 / transcript=Cvel_24641.t1 / gene=Cvel_24641 / organism=Chromera_velia_CCMP2878 / gene_product=hypothetical protein / transcript_product=hypothetical protein / location=Cvel_scaffold2691:23890-24881(+) / protein_length=90 / sequence_SO=supercontig / SO=protein_coding / is_pseudo=false
MAGSLRHNRPKKKPTRHFQPSQKRPLYGGMQQPMLQQPGVMQPSVMQPSIVQHPSVMTGMTGVTSGPYKPEYAAAFPQLSAPNEQTVSEN